MKKRSLCLFLSVLLLLTLAGCSGKATPAVPEATAVPTATPEEMAVPTATPETMAVPTATPEVTVAPTATPTPTPVPTATPAPTTAPTAAPVYVNRMTTAADVNSDIARYRDILEKYYRPFSERWDWVRLDENGLNPIYSNAYDSDPLYALGFTFLDLDANGIDELIIGFTDGGSTGQLDDIYTVKWGGAV